MATTKRGRGRPTKYTPEMVDAVAKYLASCKDKVSDYQKLRGPKVNGYDRILEVNLPSHEGFAEYIGVNPTTLYEWAAKWPVFSKSLDDIKVAQHNRLMNGGMSGQYSPVIAKLVLSSNHGYKEKSELKADVIVKDITGMKIVKE